MSDEVAERVRAAIADHGPIGFDEFMELALYGPGGFFETPPVGAERHFVTAPHVHPFVFAHCLRDALLDAWFALGEIDPLPVVELGPGDGTLADALRSAFAELPAPRPAYTGVEIGAGARDELAARGLATASGLAGLEPFEGVVVANEVLDNLPFVPVRGRPGVRSRSGSGSTPGGSSRSRCRGRTARSRRPRCDPARRRRCRSGRSRCSRSSPASCVAATS